MNTEEEACPDYARCEICGANAQSRQESKKWPTT